MVISVYTAAATWVRGLDRASFTNNNKTAAVKAAGRVKLHAKVLLFILPHT